MYRQLKIPRNFLASPESILKTPAMAVGDNDETLCKPLLTLKTVKFSASNDSQNNDNIPFFKYEKGLFFRFEKIDDKRNFKNMGYFTCFTAFIHLVSACVQLGFFVNKKAGEEALSVVRVDRTSVCWAGMRNITNHIDAKISSGMDRIDSIAILIIVFFFLSAIFQFLAFVFYKANEQYALQNRPQWLRYTEYSVSAPLMIVAIFISFGLLDIYLHLCVFVLIALCMLIGLAADFLRQMATTTDLRKLVLSLHYLAWVPMIIPWIILTISLIDISTGFSRETCRRYDLRNQPNFESIMNVLNLPSLDFTTTPIRDVSENNELPDFVWAIFFVQSFLFCVFGFVQRAQFSDEFDIRMFSFSGTINPNFGVKKDDYRPEHTWYVTERNFIILSLLAKSILGWVVFSQVLVS
jgi:hypothetical protein